MSKDRYLGVFFVLNRLAQAFRYQSTAERDPAVRQDKNSGYGTYARVSRFSNRSGSLCALIHSS